MRIRTRVAIIVGATIVSIVVIVYLKHYFNFYPGHPPFVHWFD